MAFHKYGVVRKPKLVCCLFKGQRLPAIHMYLPSNARLVAGRLQSLAYFLMEGLAFLWRLCVGLILALIFRIQEFIA